MLLAALLSLLISFTGITDHPRLLLPEGEEQLVLQAVEADEAIAKVHQGILEQSEAFLTTSPVIYKKEGKTSIMVSIGCTGGKHRSVATAEKVSAILKLKNYNVNTNHRDITKG